MIYIAEQIKNGEEYYSSIFINMILCTLKGY